MYTATDVVSPCRLSPSYPFKAGSCQLLQYSPRPPILRNFSPVPVAERRQKCYLLKKSYKKYKK